MPEAVEFAYCKPESSLRLNRALQRAGLGSCIVRCYRLQLTWRSHFPYIPSLLPFRTSGVITKHMAKWLYIEVWNLRSCM